MRRARLVLTATLLFLAGGLPACGGGGGGAGGGGGFVGTEIPTGAVEGQIRFTGFSRGVVVDAEPNDAFGQGQPLGTFHPGQRITLVGSLTADGGLDPFDGFRLRLGRRLRVMANLTLSSFETEGVSVGVYDPTGLQFAETFPADAAQELFQFTGKGSIDLVVTAAQGSVDYQLVLDFAMPGTVIYEIEPNDPAGEAQYLGELLPGDEILLQGVTDVDDDPLEAVLLACPEAVRVECTLTYDVGGQYVLRVLDASADILAPSPLASFHTGSISQESGTVDAELGTLLHIEAETTERGGQWALRLRGTAPPAPKPGLLLQSLRRPAPLATEARRLGLAERAPAYGRPREAFVPGEALVRVPSRDAAPFGRAAAARACTVGERSAGDVFRVRFDVPASLDATDRARLTLSRIRGLCGGAPADYVEPNYLRKASQVPNDTYFGYQWHYGLINLPQAWDISTGSPNVTVAILDTGQGVHPDLPPIGADGYDFVSSTYYAMDGDGIDGDPTDPGDKAYGSYSTFHGTHVAGTVAALSNNGAGVAGVCWNAKLLVLRVLGRGGAGTDYDISQAIRYAAGLPNDSGTTPGARADVINMSLGGPGFNQTLANACTAARNAGVVVIASAGNDGDSTPLYPASYDGVVSVGSVGSNMGRAPYSSYGPYVDIVAPGGNSNLDLDADGYGDVVLSTWIDDYYSPPQIVYGFMQGTSMAAPHVSGVAALMLSVDPALTPGALESALFASARDLGNPGRDDYFGHGLVDAYAALQAVGGSVPPGPPQLRLSPSILNFGTSLTTLSADISNQGEDALVIGAVTVGTKTGGDWLTAVLEGPGDTTRDADVVRVTVDRSGVSEGTHRGTVTVESNGGTKAVLVLMTVPPLITPPPPDIDIYVLAVRVESEVAVQEVAVNPAIGLDFTFPSLAVGEYLFVAGTDLDGDGEIGEEGEYVGSYPLLGAPSIVEVFQSFTWEHVDFSVSLSSSLLGVDALLAPRRTWRRPGR